VPRQSLPRPDDLGVVDPIRLPGWARFPQTPALARLFIGLTLLDIVARAIGAIGPPFLTTEPAFDDPSTAAALQFIGLTAGLVMLVALALLAYAFASGLADPDLPAVNRRPARGTGSVR
jgi:hypothetical protein